MLGINGVMFVAKFVAALAAHSTALLADSVIEEVLAEDHLVRDAEGDLIS